ncbi:unnamed protein product, partial [Staurois parvus]
CPATLLFPPHIHILLLCDQYHPNHSYFHFPKLSVYKETCIDHMMVPMRMEEDRSHMTEKILNLTLEIIYLLTGERFPLLKSGDHMTITVPPCDSLNPESHNMQKILEVTKKMMELLTGAGEDLINIKVEIKAEEEEAYVRDDQQSMEEDGITGTFIEGDTPTEISTVHGREMRKTSEDCLTLSPDWKVEDEDITQYSPGENPAPS